MGIRRTFEPMPVFEALLYMQARLIKPAQVLNNSSVKERLTVEDIMTIAMAKAVLDESLRGVPMLANLEETSGVHKWLVVATDKGVVTISEHAEIYWSDSYNVLIKQRFPTTRPKIDLVVKKALVCGLSIVRLLAYLENRETQTDTELYMITGMIHGAADIMGTADLNKELGFV